MSAEPHHHRGRAAARIGARRPRGWEVTDEHFETVLLTLPPDVTRVTASMRLSIEAEFGGWELSRVRLYSDGTRKVLLRRKRTRTTATTDNPLGHEDTDSPGDRPENEAQAC